MTKLSDHRLVDLSLSVPMDVHPQRGDAIEIAVAACIDQVVALAGDDHQRLVVRPDLHLGKWMPNMAEIEIEQALVVRLDHSESTSRSADNARSTCASLWAAESEKRSRLVSRGTGGGRMGLTNKPRSRRC